METAISLPDDAAARSSKRAAELRMTPGEFYATAVSRYLAYLDSLSLTRDIDEILARADQLDSATDAAA